MTKSTIQFSSVPQPGRPNPRDIHRLKIVFTSSPLRSSLPYNWGRVGVCPRASNCRYKPENDPRQSHVRWMSLSWAERRSALLASQESNPRRLPPRRGMSRTLVRLPGRQLTLGRAEDIIFPGNQAPVSRASEGRDETGLLVESLSKRAESPA